MDAAAPRALTIRQPYAWAIARRLKTVENRKTAWSYRGPLFIHAGAQLGSPEGMRQVGRAAHTAGLDFPDPFGRPGAPTEDAFSSVIAVATLADAHHSDDCSGKCSPWAWDGHAHLEIADPQILSYPVAASGRLGLWIPDADLIAAVRRQLP